MTFAKSDRQISRLIYNQFGKYTKVSDFYLEASMGNIPGCFVEHKFGKNSDVGTTLEPVCVDGIYRTPTTSVTLAAVSTSADDTAAGIGAREVTLVYLDTNFDIQTAVIAMNGTTETTETVTGVRRLLRAYVSESGTYATATAGSHVGEITIREAGAGQTWTRITITSLFPIGQTQIAAYTVPRGYIAFILSVNFSIDSNKTINLFFFKRGRANVTTAPFGVMRAQNIYEGLTGFSDFQHITKESYDEYTDIGFMAVDAASSSVSAEFEMILFDKTIWTSL